MAQLSAWDLILKRKKEVALRKAARKEPVTPIDFHPLKINTFEEPKIVKTKIDPIVHKPVQIEEKRVIDKPFTPVQKEFLSEKSLNFNKVRSKRVSKFYDLLEIAKKGTPGFKVALETNDFIVIHTPRTIDISFTCCIRRRICSRKNRGYIY